MTEGHTATRPARSLRGEVYEHLKSLMNEGRLRPGSYLDLNALAAEIGISRTPLRDALIRLESEGFVEILNRKGVRIRELTLRAIRDIYEIVGALESTALRSAHHRITPQVIAAMRQLNDDMTRALAEADFARYYEANLAFHHCFLDLSSNRDLLGHVRILKERLYDFPRLTAFVPDWEAASVKEHQVVVELIEAEDVRRAATFLRDVHWSFGVQEPYIRRYYAERSGERVTSA
jgi:DNA-binding GntR family transcriptional regulator